MRHLLAGACATLLLAGCGSSATEDPQAEPTTGATGATGATGTGDPLPGEDPGDPSLQPIGVPDTSDSAAEGAGPPVTLVDVRLGAHEAFDRVVFELAGEGLAGWEAGYTDEPRSQGSGQQIEVPGEAHLGIALTNIALPGDAPAGVEPWDGPERLRLPDAGVLDTLVRDTLLDGRATFFAGLDEQRPFAVGLLAEPQRIVVDVLAEQRSGTVPLTQRCESPAGFAVSYPEGWAVNSGETAPACTRFAPEAFTVPPGTDARTGAITASIEPVDADRIAASDPDRDLQRRETTVDGRPAVRVERESQGRGLWPEGTRSTSYVVGLADGDDGPRTLVLDTVGLPQFDYARNVGVLDRMAETLEITAAG
ncbi:AMIN-like domain-containing (lipo)protein [Modestobacter sp. SYSU DS0511]